MSESLPKLPTLSPPPLLEEERVWTGETMVKSADPMVVNTEEANVSAIMAYDNNNTIDDDNNNTIDDDNNGTINHDIDHDDTATNMLPQMNVYILDDTPSVTSQMPLPLTPVKDIRLDESESFTGLRQSSPYKEPDTTLSLDKEEPVSDLDKSPPSDPEHRRINYHNNNNNSDAQQQHHHHYPMMVSARADPDDDNDDNDDSSSHDDSSYFASHLPEPNSARRRYSGASHASQNSSTFATTTTTQPPPQPSSFPGANTTTSAVNRHNNNNNRPHGRESDASLSLSDDSDEQHHNHHHHGHHPVQFGPGPPHHPHYYPQLQPPTQAPPLYHNFQPPSQHHQQQQQHQHFSQPPQHSFIMPLPRGGAVPELYPQQIMPRMHSVHSLASTSSQSGSDTSLPDELQHVVTTSQQQQQQRLRRGNSSTGSSHFLPSGRRSPILGEHPPSRGGASVLLPSFGSPSSVNLQPSPPMILQSFSAAAAASSTNHHRHHPNNSGTNPNDNISSNNNNNDTTSEPRPLVVHPQPQHSMTPEELTRFLRLGSGGGDESFPTTTTFPLGARGESDFVYSGDSDSHRHQHRTLAAAAAAQSQHHEPPHAFGEPNRDHPTLQRLHPDEHHRRSWSWEPPLVGDGGDGMGPTAAPTAAGATEEDRGFKVYWQRWIMLMYMSILNLLSDWTCYSVAPIALLTEEAFGNINAEQLVVVFLIANGIATACEPIILSRLGLRRTILFGSLLLMIGSIVKSGGMPPIIQADLKKGQGEWRVYLGFFLVGLSQPLYQCTPALLSASWFPEAERTLATGVALNANQLGIGFAFIFGTMLVETSDDIPKYFGLLSILSTLTFLGTLVQFDDAPPTPPSDTAKVIRGTLEAKLPSVQSIFETVRNIGVPSNPFDSGKHDTSRRNSSRKDKSRLRNEKYQRTISTESKARTSKNDESEARHATEAKSRPSRRSGTAERRASRRTTGSGSNIARRRNTKQENIGNSGAGTEFQTVAPSPSPALWGPVRQDYDGSNAGNVDDQDSQTPLITSTDVLAGSNEQRDSYDQNAGSYPYYSHPPYPAYPGHPGEMYNNYPTYPPQYQIPYWDPQYAQFVYYQQQQAHLAYYPIQPPPDTYMSYQHSYPYQPYPFASYEPPEHLLPATDAIDEGAEPVITILPHHLDIHIRDDQIWLSTRACLARPGFIHSLVSFTVSGVVINTLSTFMDYLVRLNGAGREYTGVVGGTFQFVIMISSLIIGKVCDKTRAYYSITIGMLVLGAFGLAECGVSLDSNSGVSLRWSLIIVALLVGPLQPVSTELGVDVVYPLSENTVLVIQQLFSNLLSAAFIPCFKAMKNLGEGSLHDGTTERPSYTFSFYLLIVVHACATVFFATFNGRYLRYEHELEKQAQDERRKFLQQQAHLLP